MRLRRPYKRCSRFCRAQKVEEACRFLERHIEAVRKDLLQVVGGAITPKSRRKEKS